MRFYSVGNRVVEAVAPVDIFTGEERGGLLEDKTHDGACVHVPILAVLRFEFNNGDIIIVCAVKPDVHLGAPVGLNEVLVLEDSTVAAQREARGAILHGDGSVWVADDFIDFI